MNNNSNSCIIGHAGARDFYQLALAFYEEELLDTLVTDFFVTNSVSKIAKRVRFNSGIPFNKVKIEPVACWEFIKSKLPFLPTPRDYVKKDTAISKRCLKMALRNNRNLFLYSYYAYDAFHFLSKNNCPNKKFLFQVHPHPLSIRKILKEEIERLPYTRSSIENESEFLINAESLEKLSQEIHLSDHCIVASSFTKKTLLENGVVNPEKISIVPYGVDQTKFPEKIRSSKISSNPFNIIFIGSMIQRKGLADLLLAIRILKSKNIQLTLVGHKMDKQLIENFSDLDITIKFKASHEDLLREMHTADVFVLPSLAEGFAHVILEAMSSGLPVITTNNTAGPDLITNGIEGFLIPIKSPEIIAEKIETLINNRDLCEHMGQAAALKARNLTWQKFRNDIVSFYKSEQQTF